MSKFSKKEMIAAGLTPLEVGYFLSTTGNEIDPHGVNHPAHYNTDPSGVECIVIVRHMNFNVGSAFKYVFRAGKKDAALKDLKKAVWYLDDEIAANTYWTNNTPMYKNELLAVINSRTGNLKSAFEAFYLRNLATARAYILAEIQRLEIKKLEEHEVS